MRSSRVLALTLVVSLFAAAPSAFAKVCHPKKPITCQATHFSTSSSFAPVAAAPAKVKATSVTTKSHPKVQQAMLCGPWVKWMCTAQPLV